MAGEAWGLEVEFGLLVLPLSAQYPAQLNI